MKFRASVPTPRQIFAAVGKLEHDGKAEIAERIGRIAADHFAICLFGRSIVEQQELVARQTEQELEIRRVAPDGFENRLQRFFVATLALQ